MIENDYVNLKIVYFLCSHKFWFDLLSHIVKMKFLNGNTDVAFVFSVTTYEAKLKGVWEKLVEMKIGCLYPNRKE